MMVGWRVMVTYPTGRQNERQWHDGFIIRYEEAHLACGADCSYYVAFIRTDSGEERLKGWELPNHGVCFRKPHLPNSRVSERMKSSVRVPGAKQTPMCDVG